MPSLSFFRGHEYAYGRIVSSFEGVANPYTYTAREFDAESGLTFYRARYYDADTGRFISEDPIGFAAGDSNLYRYVFNNPVNLTDPSGLEAIIDADIAGPKDEVLEECFRQCLKKQIGMTEGISGVAATPVPKRAIGVPVARGTSAFTNPVSMLDFEIAEKTGKRIGIPGGKNLLGTSRLLRAAGRANAISFVALSIYDLAQASLCAKPCKEASNQCKKKN